MTRLLFLRMQGMQVLQERKDQSVRQRSVDHIVLLSQSLMIPNATQKFAPHKAKALCLTRLVAFPLMGRKFFTLYALSSLLSSQ